MRFEGTPVAAVEDPEATGTKMQEKLKKERAEEQKGRNERLETYSYTDPDTREERHVQVEGGREEWELEDPEN